jgi:ribosomal protein L11 methyltransferase
VSWLQITVALHTQEAQAFEDVLVNAGAVAITYESHADEVVLEPAPGAIPMWQQISLVALFSVDTNLAGLNESLRALDPQVHERLEIDFIAEEDWQRRLSNHTVRAQFGGKLWLLPKSEQNSATASQQQTPATKALYLEPGLAFGSGSHPTTRMCLEWLAQHTKAQQSVLDFGCGSGILAIAAALLGATVVAVDHDPQALLATRENAEFNAIGDRVQTLSLEQWQAQKDEYKDHFDVVVANILAAPIIELEPTFCDILQPGGELVLSGILQSQAPQVMDAYPRVAFESPSLEAEWACLSGRLTV